MDFWNISREQAQNTKLDIYLLAGQSNACGTSKIEMAPEEARDRNVYENVRYYHDRTNTDGEIRCCMKDFRPVQEGQGFCEDRIGPELGMARSMSKRYATDDRKAAIVKCAAGGTSLRHHEPLPETLKEAGRARFYQRGSWYPSVMETGGNTDPNRPTGFLTRKFKTVIAESYALLLEHGFRPENIRYCALCWMQGEEDRLHPDTYEQLFPLFAAEIRDALSETTGCDYRKLPIIMGEISETFGSANPETVQKNRAFIAMQHELAKHDPTITVIHTAEFELNRWENDESIPVGSDNAHWSYTDMLAIGEMFGDAAYDGSHAESF